jgi:hypothetical protein
MTIGTDFNQFCAACELLFCVLLNAALEYIILKNAVLVLNKKSKCCSGIKNFNKKIEH